MTLDSLSRVSYGQVNTKPNYNINHEFGYNVTPTNITSEKNAYPTRIIPTTEEMELAEQLYEKDLGVEGAHQAYASSNPYAVKGPEWYGIAFPPSDGNGNFVPVVVGGECGNKFDSTTYFENINKV